MTGTNKACEIKLITKKIPYQINQKHLEVLPANKKTYESVRRSHRWPKDYSLMCCAIEKISFIVKRPRFKPEGLLLL